MDEWVSLVQAIAWPIVALIAVLILANGLLEKLLGTLADSLFGLTKAVADFKENTATMKADMDRFAQTSRELSENFAAKIDSIKKAIESTETQIDALSAKTERVAQSSSALLQEYVAKEVDASTGFTADDAAPEEGDKALRDAEKLNADQMYDGMRDVWDDLVAVLKGIIGVGDFDGRQIGRMAYFLTDGRRKLKVKLSKEEAQSIASLHSQLKSFNRLSSTKEDWLNADVYLAFTRAVIGATELLRAKTN